MYKIYLSHILTIFLSFSLGQNILAQTNSNSDSIINEIYEEMTTHDLEFIHDSEISLENMIVSLEKITSYSPSKKRYSKFLKNFLDYNIKEMLAKGYSDKESLLILEAHICYCANKFFSLKNMHFMKEGFKDFKGLKKHEKSRRYFFDCLKLQLQVYKEKNIP